MDRDALERFMAAIDAHEERLARLERARDEPVMPPAPALVVDWERPGYTLDADGFVRDAAGRMVPLDAQGRPLAPEP